MAILNYSLVRCLTSTPIEKVEKAMARFDIVTGLGEEFADNLGEDKCKFLLSVYSHLDTIMPSVIYVSFVALII